MATAVRKKRGKSSPSTNEDAPQPSNPLISDAKLKQLYSRMLQCRILDKRSRELRGGSGKAARFLAAEAVTVGATLDLRRDDWLVPRKHDLLGKFVKGMPLLSIVSELRPGKASHGPGKQEPVAYDRSKYHSPFHIASSAENPAAQLNLASGIALALQAKKTGNIVMAFCGDTSDSGERWQKALAFAGRHCLPLLVVVQTKASPKLPPARAKKTIASLLSEGNLCQVPIIPVDADDVVAIYRVAYESIHKARHGGGPTLIQAISLPHLPNGDSSKEHVKGRPDAIAKMEVYLAAKALFSPSWKQQLIDTFNKDVDSALKTGKKHPSPNRE